MKFSHVGLISKEGHGEAKAVARDIAEILLSKGFSVTSFPNLHMKGVEHVSTVKDLSDSKIDLVMTVSGDGTILRLLRILDNTLPCLCVNVGGRGILAEIKPDQAKIAIEKIQKDDFHLEKRIRIEVAMEDQVFPPALNEVCVLRQSVTNTPMITIDFDGAVFSQRMDGLLVSTPTGSTGHSYSYGSPFLDGSLDVFAVTPVGPISRFPNIVTSDSKIRLMGNYALQLIIDGQDVFNVEANAYITFKKHERDAVFVRFDTAGRFRQLKNLRFS